MRTMILLAALLAAGPALADNNSRSDSNSVSNSQSGAAANTTNAINFNSSTPEKQTVSYGGDYTVRSAPGTVLGGFSGSFSPDSCTSTVQGGASWLGGSFALGKPIRDVNCERMRVVERLGQTMSSTPANNAPVAARRLHSLMVKTLCAADVPQLMDDCKSLGLVGKDGDAWK